MGYFSRFNPVGPVKDLRLYFHRRGPKELAFLSAALVGTAVVMGMFIIDTPPQPHKEREIIYVQQWKATRTDAEVKAQQVKDKPAEDAEKARVAAAYEKHRLELKRLDDKLRRWGL